MKNIPYLFAINRTLIFGHKNPFLRDQASMCMCNSQKFLPEVLLQSNRKSSCVLWLTLTQRAATDHYRDFNMVKAQFIQITQMELTWIWYKYRFSPAFILPWYLYSNCNFLPWHGVNISLHWKISLFPSTHCVLQKQEIQLWRAVKGTNTKAQHWGPYLEAGMHHPTVTCEPQIHLPAQGVL